MRTEDPVASDLPVFQKKPQIFICIYILTCKLLYLKVGNYFKTLGTSLVVQRLRIRLPVQGTWVQFLV